MMKNFESAWRALVMSFGIDLYLKTEDRQVLEKIIFPYILSQPQYARILFVGCEWYTRGYNQVFKQRDYWTLDRDQAQRKFGAKRHIVDSVENITAHFADNTLDMVMCNGLLGWGLNEKAGFERAMLGCMQILRPGGLLLFGWNDLPQYLPFKPTDCASINAFTPYVFPPLATTEYHTGAPHCHVFNFYIK